MHTEPSQQHNVFLVYKNYEYDMVNVSDIPGPLPQDTDCMNRCNIIHISEAGSAVFNCITEDHDGRIEREE